MIAGLEGEQTTMAVSANRLELLQIADAVAREKAIDRMIVVAAMEDAIQKAARQRYGSETDVRAEINPKTGEIKLQRLLKVVEAIENPATDILLERVTKEAVNARLRMCGLERTTVTMTCRELLYDLVGLGAAPDGPETRRLAADRLRRREIDPNSRVYNDDRANMTTPREMGSLLDQIVRPTLNGGGPGLPVDVCRQILAVMRRQQVRDRLPLFLPAAVEVAHKTGSLSRVSNDAGILYAPRGQCVIAIFTKDLADDFKGRLAIGQAARAVFEAFS